MSLKQDGLGEKTGKKSVKTSKQKTLAVSQLPEYAKWYKTLSKEEQTEQDEREHWNRESYKFENKRWLKRQEKLKNVATTKRHAANKEIGEVEIIAGSEALNPGQFRKYKSHDYSIHEEMESPMKVDWNREQKLRAWGYKYGKPYLVEMSPDDFLGFSYELLPQLTSEISIERIKQGIKDGNTFDTPFIDLSKTGYATGKHEGRHRATALKQMGIKMMPVIIYDNRFDNGDYFADRTEPRLVRDLLKEK